jgi:acetoacetyl-CoA synthetase
MMWPFMLTGLACGARIVLYDGSPFYPDLRGYLKFINDQGCEDTNERGPLATKLF